MTEDTQSAQDTAEDVKEGYVLNLSDNEVGEIYTTGMLAFSRTKEAILNHSSHATIAYYFAWLETQLSRITGAMTPYTKAKAIATDDSGLLGPLSGGGSKPD